MRSVDARSYRLWDIPALPGATRTPTPRPPGLRIRPVREWAWGRLFTLGLALVALAGLYVSCSGPVLQ